jgi:ubiquinone/menaquinone biosynthesis C-methylase UbiE
MILYDFLAPMYDPVLESIYRPFRTRSLEALPASAGASVLDLACGTGQNFSFLAGRIGAQGKIIGVDVSSGMLRRAACRVKRSGLANVILLQTDAACFSSSRLEAETELRCVDLVTCTYGFTSIREWEAAFWSSWQLLRPGGVYVIHDVDGQKRNMHTLAVEMITRCDFSLKVWRPLKSACHDFRMDYLDPSAHLFGGRLFVACGTKPFT